MNALVGKMGSLPEVSGPFSGFHMSPFSPALGYELKLHEDHTQRSCPILDFLVSRTIN